MRILLLRALLGGFLCTPIFTPLFVFAQTATTTTDQSTSSTAQQTIDNLMQQQLSAVPTPDQILTNSISSQLEVKTVPLNPGPGDTEQVSVESYLSDLNKAYITWTLNNKVALSGVGAKVFSFKNGASGQTTTLVVTITTNGGQTITKNFSWTPVGITLFWQADTYTPPFYRGKPLLSPQARVMVIATPDNTGPASAFNANNLVYTWQQEGTVNTAASGYGKNSFSFTGPIPLSRSNVSVQVSSLDNTMNSDAQIPLTLSNPFVLFYKNDPLLGVLYNQPLAVETSFTGKELSMSAEPFFFSRDNADAQIIQYEWSVNGQKVQNDSRIIILRNNAGITGSSNVSLTVSSLRQMFQLASQNLRVNFSATDSTSKPIF